MYKKDSSVINYQCFCDLRNEFKIMNRFLYDSYILEIQDIRLNPKKIWNFANSRRSVIVFHES